MVIKPPTQPYTPTHLDPRVASVEAGRYDTHGTHVEVFVGNWETGNVLVLEVELDANSCLTEQERETINEALLKNGSGANLRKGI